MDPRWGWTNCAAVFAAFHVACVSLL
jgi:hypothetical protein